MREEGGEGRGREGGGEGIYIQDLAELSILNIHSAVTEKLKRKASTSSSLF